MKVTLLCHNFRRNNITPTFNKVMFTPFYQRILHNKHSNLCHGVGSELEVSCKVSMNLHLEPWWLSC